LDIEQPAPASESQPETTPPQLQAEPQSGLPLQPTAPNSPIPPQPIYPGGPATESPTPDAPTGNLNQASPINKKMLILIGAIVGGLLAIILVVFLVIMPIFGVSKAEYAEAYQITSTAESSLSEVVDVDLEYQNDVEAITKSWNNNEFESNYQAYQNEITKLTADSKPIKNDEYAKQLYDRVVAKNQQLDEVTGAVSEAFEKVWPKIIGMAYSFYDRDDIDNIPDESVISEAIEDLRSITGLEYEINQNFINLMLDAADVSLEQFTNPAEVDLSAPLEGYPLQQDPFVGWFTEINRLMDEADPSDELNELTMYFSEKSI
jgi:hypothetical protein